MDAIIIKARSEVKVTVTPKWYVILRHISLYGAHRSGEQFRATMALLFFYSHIGFV